MVYWTQSKTLMSLSLFFVCLLFVYCLFTVCLLFVVYCLFFLFSLFVLSFFSLCPLSLPSLKELLWLRDEAGKFEIYGHGDNTNEVLQQFPFVPSWHVRVSGEGRPQKGKSFPTQEWGESKVAADTRSGGGSEVHKPWWQYRYVGRKF